MKSDSLPLADWIGLQMPHFGVTNPTTAYGSAYPTILALPMPGMHSRVSFSGRLWPYLFDFVNPRYPYESSQCLPMP